MDANLDILPSGSLVGHCSLFGLLILGLEKGRPGAVVRVVSLSHQVAGSKQPLRIFAGEVLPRFFSSPDPTHVGASGTGSAL